MSMVEALSQADILACGMIVAAIITLPVLIYGPTAPYGRYSTTGWGVLIPNKIAWFTQELWSLAIPALWLAFFSTPDQLKRLQVPANGLLMIMFMTHYIYRDVIYPFRLRGGKPTPFIVWLSAFVFCVYNGYMQTKYLLDQAPMDAVIGPKWIFGFCLWVSGWLINLQSDNILISLRRKSDKKGVYRIPKGGMFEYVSAANYFGEILEWTGYAIASSSLPGIAFAVFTFANLAPRGWKHHAWYNDYFKTYHRLKRKAVIPFLI
ncbi:hypothetical protein M9435_001912 [Picochlorum sp. BPE23]|nr:hypothetical protein M9435_001912 [Picochlorum sp. BPE23]